MKHPLQIAEQQPDEQRVFVVHRHEFLFFRHALFLILLAALPIIVILVVPLTHDAVVNRDPGGVLIVMALSAYLLGLGLSFLNTWVDYYLDAWIVSTKRIVNIEQEGLFSRVVSELVLDNVQDVTVEVHGVLPTMLHYGDVFIQTASENPRFHFENVPRPYEVAEKIMDLHRAYVKNTKQAAADVKAVDEKTETPTFLRPT